MEPKIGSGSSGSIFIAGSAGSVQNGSGFRFPVRFQRFLKVRKRASPAGWLAGPVGPAGLA